MSHVVMCGSCGMQSQQAGSNGHDGVARDDAKTVFVRNVSFQASESEIRDFFSQAGKVVQVRRQTDDQGQPPFLVCPFVCQCYFARAQVRHFICCALLL